MSKQITSLALVTFLLIHSQCFSQRSTTQPELRETVIPRLGLPTTLDADQAFWHYEKDPLIANLATQLRASSGETRRRGIALNLAFGNEYQLLDWLEKRRVDGGLLSPLAAYLLWRGEAKSDEQVNSSEKQGYHFFQPIRSDDGSEIPVMIRSVMRDKNGAWNHREKPDKDFIAFLEAVWTATRGGKTEKTLLVMPSHLSLCGFLAPIKCGDAFLGTKVSSELSKQYWTKFFDRTRFLLTPSHSSWDDTLAGIHGEEKVESIIEFRSEDEIWSAENGWKHFFLGKDGDLKQSKKVMPPGKIFVINNAFGIQSLPGYQKVENLLSVCPYGNCVLERVRPSFQFHIPELMKLIDQDQQTSKISKLALVLPGGGVKACYQSQIVDHLYQKHYLENGSKKNAAQTALSVECVCGNSGGALLGCFVASLKKDDERLPLTDMLWFPNGHPIDWDTIFPAMDMLRWFTFWVCCLIFCLVLRATKWMGLVKINTDSSVACLDEKSRFLYSLVWATFLFFIPFGVRYANGAYGREHIPAVEGFVYFFCVCIAIAGDSCFILRKHSAYSRIPSTRAWILFAAGMIMGAVGLIWRGLVSGNGIKNERIFGLMPLYSLFYCIGVLFLLAAMFSYMFDQKTRFTIYKHKEFFWSLLILCSIPLLSYISLFVFSYFDTISLFELTNSFWIALGLSALTVSLAVILIAVSGKKTAGWRHHLYSFLQYLWSIHPTETLKAPRLVRVLLFGFFAWSWWNIIVAPAVYGNDDAQTYLVGRMDEFYKISQGVQPTPKGLQTTLIVPATALETNQERYFCISPYSHRAFHDSVSDRLSQDPRWRHALMSDNDLTELRDFVFASGSPFPLFPAHRLEYKMFDTDQKQQPAEFLVDGGYAHNVPIEAAKIVGARQVLLVNSTPAPLESTAGSQSGSPEKSSWPAALKLSQLFNNAQRLLPFLYDRSQLMDEQSREGLFIATLAPSNDEDWPLLFDFRRSVIEKLRDHAKLDIARRIGKVENWGTPRFWRHSYRRSAASQPSIPLREIRQWLLK